jgi:hypothetical protein
MEAACRRASEIGAPSRKCVEMILKNGQERIHSTEEPAATPVFHENMRGGSYFGRGEQEADPTTSRITIAQSPTTKQSEPSCPGVATSQCKLSFDDSTLLMNAPTQAHDPQEQEGFDQREDPRQDLDLVAPNLRRKSYRYTN